ncbi:LysR substrate-binding domain-containing protein [Roseomonas fluvialis]|uniref:LysR family transcriptional regulator n=1 Tax=Roseomonas fluvialis TaxID=1750527 RepID=A0ABM8I5L0_9PROT|nr:LysR substrate-binding domain-containing protein [Roseomonas fluvialis]BDG71715.1 LysR family transcriptional regulator [Roseomonas fluvialis]
MINFREVQLLRTMLQLGSVSETARTLNISQPAVSQALTAIQLELGIALFDRVRGRLRPTSHALRLLPDLERLVGNISGFHDLVLTMREGRAGYLSVATAPTIASGLLPAAVTRFRQQHPNVHISILSADIRETIDRVARGQADLGITQLMEGEVVVHSASIAEGAVICVMPSGHRLRARTSVTPTDLAQEDIVSFRPSSLTGMRILEAFRLAGVRLKLAVETNQAMTAMAMVASGGGVALIDSFFPPPPFFPGLVQRPFEPRIRLPVQVILPESRPLSKLADSFLADLKDTIGGNEAFSGGPTPTGVPGKKIGRLSSSDPLHAVGDPRNRQR